MFKNNKIWNENEYIKFKSYLYLLSNKKYKLFSKKIKSSEDEIIGINIPKLRSIAKEIIKTNIDSFLKYCKYDSFEEKMIIAFVISYSKVDINKKYKLIYDFVDHINSWALCDSFVSSLKLVKENKEMFLNIIEEFLKDSKEYKIRFAVVMLLCYYITDEYIDYILDKLVHIKNNEYYCYMAISWCLCECYIYNKNKTFKYIKNKKFSGFVHNKTISKICDSFKVNNEEKKMLKKYRI